MIFKTRFCRLRNRCVHGIDARLTVYVCSLTRLTLTDMLWLCARLKLEKDFQLPRETHSDLAGPPRYELDLPLVPVQPMLTI